MAKNFPNWMMLDRFVYRRDDAFALPFWASSCTSLGQIFKFAIYPAKPPAISRFYVWWPGGTKLEDGQGTDLVDAHYDFILFRLTSVQKLEEYPYLCYNQDHFVCQSLSEPEPHVQLKRLPVCTIPVTIPPGEDEEKETVLPRVFFPKTVGLHRQFATESSEEKFIVAQLAKVSKKPESREMEAEICVLRSQVYSDDGDGEWEVMTVPIQHADHEYEDLWYWSTDDVVKFKNYICWVDYYRGGMLFYDALQEKPTLLYRRLKISNRPIGSVQCQTLPEMNRRLGVTTDWASPQLKPCEVLRFVEVARLDEHLLSPFELGSGFRINSSHLSSIDGEWAQDCSITSQDLWASNTESLPHDMLLFPVVDMQTFAVVHFLMSRYAADEETKKDCIVTLDMLTKHVKEVVPCIEAQNVDMIDKKAHLLNGFMSSWFTMFLKVKPGEDFHHQVLR